jgi:hypothetical protein
MGSRNRFQVRFPERVRDFFLLHNVQTGIGAQPPFCRMSTNGCFPGGGATVACSSPSFPPDTEIRNDGAKPPLPRTSSWRGDRLIN